LANEDKATKYQRLNRRASVIGTAVSALFFIFLLASGTSAALRDSAVRAGGGSFYTTLVLYVAAVAVVHDLIQLPLAFYQGVTLERRYGLSTQTTQRWWRDHLKAWAVGLLLALFASTLTWTLIRWGPEWWWAAAAVVFAAVLVLLAQLAPLLLLPLFYEFKPLDRPELARRLLALADRAGTPVLGVFEWRLSDRTRKANAALAGLGSTRRILLSDTLLAEHSDDEIEVILAHELAHHVYLDIWSGIAVEAGLLTAGFYLADLVLEAFAQSFGLVGKADVAALPLLVLAIGAASLLLLPLANAFSRAHERRADRYALTMTRNADAFVVAMRRLAAQNLAEDHPSPIVEALFHSHPSTSARIAAAEAWKRGDASPTPCSGVPTSADSARRNS
jgi:STE24 endopeptidase